MIIRPARIKNLNHYFFALILPSLIPVLNSSVYSGFSALFSAGLLLRAEYKRARIKYLIKNNEIIHEVGILNKTKNVTKIDRVTQMQVTQSFFQKLLNYGTLDLETWGSSLKLENIKRPQLIVDRIKELQKDSDY